MNDTTTDPEPMEIAVHELLSAKGAFDVEAWLGRHAAIAEELRPFLDDADGVISGLRELGRAGFTEPDLDSDQRFVGDYELLERVGGNMGVVYRARQRSLPREVAVKLLRREGDTARDRFRAEAHAMARMRHPHILRILEVSRGDSVPYFSMEWLPGGCLEDWRTRLHAPRDAARMVEKAARAIHFAHQRGVLHRDIKPANILLDENGEPHVADFGLAMLLEDGRDGSTGGTPSYMAPEQLEGEATVATDVHGLGCLLYALLTGRPPFVGANLSEVMQNVRSAAPAEPSTVRPAVDADLDAICAKCLAKDPTLRYASAAALADDLAAYAVGGAVAARPLGTFGRLNRILRDARSAEAFRKLGPGLYFQAAVNCGLSVAIFALIRIHAPEWSVWIAVFASYIPLFALFLLERRRSGESSPARLHLWTIWMAHAAACVAVFVAFRMAFDYPGAIHAGLIATAGLDALTFAIMGGLFNAWQFVWSGTWMVAAVFMGIFPESSPLIYGGLIGACTLGAGVQLNALTAKEKE